MSDEAERPKLRWNASAEQWDKFTLYGVTVARVVACAPSYLLAAACFAPSRYESKLWDLKHVLKANPATTKTRGKNKWRISRTSS